MYDINNSLFKYPIEYLKNKKKTSKNLCEDLELLSTKDKENKPVLNIIFNPKTVYGKKEVDAVVKCLQESTQMGNYSRKFESKIANLFDKKCKKLLFTKILNKGDLIFMNECGHSFKFIKNSLIIEIKQGPYLGIKDKNLF